jgi:signal transduction histidine kinase
MRLDDNIKSLDGCLERVRNLSLDLRPSILDDLGLVAALRWQLERFQERAEFQGHLTAEHIPERFEPDVETACFRVAQEALTNVARHAKAHNVEMNLRLCDEELVLSIQDDGIGFDSGKALAEAVHGKSFGVLGMQERVALLDGRLEINSSVGKGTVIGVWLPLRVPRKQQDDHQNRGI